MDGPAEHCIARLRGLVDLGIDKLIVTPPSIEADRGEAIRAMQMFAADVLPAITARS